VSAWNKRAEGGSSRYEELVAGLAQAELDNDSAPAGTHGMPAKGAASAHRV
jgi:hypothetical protein